MTLEEVSEKYEVAASSLKSNFTRTAASILKKYGVRIVKIGRGASATYKEEWEDDMRALTMYEATKDTMMITED